MMSGEEGKLLAGAVGFYSPWGSESDEQAHRTLRHDSFVMPKKRRFASSAGTCIPLHSHQGEREKNEYL
jgi:hypothetical protein